jgi:hypothetical protein
MPVARVTTIVAVALFLGQASAIFAQQGDLTLLPFSPSQSPPMAAPPFAYISRLQDRWDYSDRVCTGTAEAPVSTGVIENLGGTDRDQLASRVAIENCFKGQIPVETITVLRDNVVAEKDVHGGWGYSGPPTGFLSRGRNLLFLRHTEDPTLWRVTIPVFATCIPLADDAPSSPFDRSLQAVPDALVVEFGSAIEQGPRPLGNSEYPVVLANSEYLEYIWQILSKDRGILELKSFMERSSWTIRQDIALYMLNRGYSDGLTEVIALLEDNGTDSWKRANAARLLRNESSAQVKQALERAAAQPGPKEVIEAATKSLAYLNRDHQ